MKASERAARLSKSITRSELIRLDMTTYLRRIRPLITRQIEAAERDAARAGGVPILNHGRRCL